MSTNRTKTDWAYRRAQRIVLLVLIANGAENSQSAARKTVREIAGKLRAAYRRGYDRGRVAEKASWPTPDVD